MSGRLVILPKKSYCPWKRENVERVMRDERLEKERSEKQQQQREEQEVVTRKRKRTLESFDEASQELHGGNEILPATGHINLFQEEEDAYLKGITPRINVHKQDGIMPVILGQSELNARGANRPFYMRTRQEFDVLPSKEDTQKIKLDPMKDFVRHKKEAIGSDNSSASSRRHRKKKHKKSKWRSEKKEDGGNDTKRRRRQKNTKLSTLEELRQRRREREEFESKRASMLLQNDHQSDDRRRSYQNQYNPGLSRR